MKLLPGVKRLMPVIMLFWNATAFAQQIFPPLPEAQRPHIRAEYTTDPITIDGKGDEPAWQKASVATNFIISYPRQGDKASFETEVRLLYDNTNIYILARCQFPPGKKKMQVQNMRRDFGFTDNELFEVLIDPFKDPKLPVMAFCVTPYGTQMDIMHYHDGSYDYNWDAVWKGASDIQEHSWTTEIAIPFSTLRYPVNSTEWSINFVHNIRMFGEANGWSAWPLAFSESRMEYAGIVTNIHPPDEKINLRFEPYTLINANRTASGKTNYKPQAGGEIKYAINPSTTLEATVNTDFAQADVDRQVINLTRSNVFFPEKRQFFLENSSIFAVGQNSIIQPFFSRRIGLSDNGAPLPIDGGFRLVHQDSKQAYGVLIMKQQGDSLQNSALFSVLRYKRSIGKDLQVGGMGILKDNLGGLGQPAYANPVGVVDVFWRANQALFIRGMESVSGNTLTNKTGSSTFGELNYSTNELLLDWFETRVSKNYESQTGYVAREDFINTQPNLYLNIHKKWFPKSISFYSPQLTADIYHQASTGHFQEANVNLIPFALIFNNLAQVNVNVTSSWEHLTDDFIPVRNVKIQKGNYQFNRYEAYLLTNQGASYSAEARVSTGGYYDGTLNSYYLSLRAAPITRFAFVLSITQNDFKNSGAGNVFTTTRLFAPELRMAVNPKILLSSFYQYNTDARNGSLNARFSWEYRPLSFIYLVYNNINNYYKTPFDIPQKQQSGILKLTYIHQL